jgi:ketosteroid isomerase-like protein
MIRLVSSMGCALALVTGLVTGQSGIPQDLAALADAERAFAKAASVKGWRDAFLEFFADDAIAFAPGVVSAKDRLRKQPSTPFSEVELVWEPRTGDVAASGDLGWLTGPSSSINHKSPDPKRGYGCYLSIWRKQPDGAWRVFIDVGINGPEPVQFAPGFTRTAVDNRYARNDGKAAATASLASADRDLNGRLESEGPARAFVVLLTPSSRLHRPGLSPVVGREAIGQWLELNARAGTAKDTAAEAAVSGDLGFSYGTFTVTEPKPLGGVYVRLWSRDAAGKWWLMADVAS